MPKYATYYDCSGWRSLVEVMNADTKPGSFTIKAFTRKAVPVFQEKHSLGGHESIRIDVYGWLKQHGYLTDAEGLVMVEPEPRMDPVNTSLEFPAVLIIAPADSDDDHEDYFKWNRFVPFTRIP